MAASPRWKVYDADSRYQAACKDSVAAAVLVQFYGQGATIRDGHTRVCWTENGGADRASIDGGMERASYDDISQACLESLLMVRA